MVSEAEYIVDTMRMQGIDPDVFTYNALINGHCLQKRMDKARSILQLMIKKGCGPHILRRTSSACELLRMMLASGQVPDLVTCSILLDGFRRRGKLQEALKLFQAMRNSKLELNIVCYNIFIDGLCKAGHIEAGKDIS
ncbi:hypothetical protein Godav_023402 [Gossypium davidsonii]|uniref:Pentacotripeptide-repeat region of PRORP domain-containing protein n=2 Tax=Gossypium TaxID=3633 RepID=A0A7J8SS34_GOSDV|nr:hypothetical protein [Gossypium davidsonii]MBA0664421.1 hypothetical protein [Gossypium klotzschianum]